MSASGGSPSGSPNQMEAARTPLATGGQQQPPRRPWARFVGPLVAVVALAAAVVGLLLLLADQGALSIPADKKLGTKVECGVYQDPADPTVKLTDAEVWAADGALLGKRWGGLG